MIMLKKEEVKQILTNEELEFLAKAYIKLKKNPRFVNFSKSFQDYIYEYFEKELIAQGLKIFPEDKIKDNEIKPEHPDNI